MTSSAVEGEQALKKKTTGKSSGSAAAVEEPLAKKKTGKSSGSAAAVVDESDSDFVAEVAKSLGGPTGIYSGTDSGEGVKEIYSGRLLLKVELQSWINGPVIFRTDIEVLPSMTVKAVRRLVWETLFNDNGHLPSRW
jgi:hypothetical protein